MYKIGNKVARDHKFQKFSIMEVNSEDIVKLVKYDIIELEVEKFMEEFYTKLLQIRNNTRQMKQLFSECLANHQDIIKN